MNTKIMVNHMINEYRLKTVCKTGAARPRIMKELEEKTGVNESTISNYKRGITDAKLGNLQAIAQVCGFELKLVKIE